MPSTDTHKDIQGNHACALGAIAAGCKFFAGYPITPSSEIAERMSIELPKNAKVLPSLGDTVEFLSNLKSNS